MLTPCCQHTAPMLTNSSNAPTGECPVLTLLTFKPALGLRSPSPFAVKGEALMAMSGLEYGLDFPDVRKMPNQKLPVLKVGERLIPDTAHIQTCLETEHGVDFDSHLTDEQKAIAMAFRRLIENHIYHINALQRWTDHADTIKETFFQEVPALLRGFIFGTVQKKVVQTANLHGVGRHSPAEITAFAVEDLNAIATLLGDQKFFFGDQPSSIDASLYGMLHGLIDCTLDTPVKDAAMKHKNLTDYCTRFRKQVFND